MTQKAAQRAIKAALAGKWNEAVEFNLQILLQEPDNIDALNRLARAQASIGQTKKARKTWNKVLRLDRYNPIAKQQLEKLKSAAPSKTRMKPAVSTSGETFLDEPGKTKTTQLVRLADAKKVMSLEPGQTVKLFPKKRLITVVTQSGDYLGALPDDLSTHLARLIKGGNKYEALIRRVKKNTILVFLKEIKRSKRYQNTPSFLGHKLSPAIAIEPTASINETPINTTPTGEEEDYK